MGVSAKSGILSPMRWTLLAVLFLLPPAMAEDEAYLIAFTEGRYEEAAILAEADATSDSLAFAARSLLAEAMSAEDFIPPPPLVEQAEQYARTALLLDPDHPEARLQLAIALSLLARPLTTSEAMRTGYGEESKSLALDVLSDDPMNVYANGFMAVWHVEVRRRGGAIGASILGASIKKARTHYARAITYRGDDASIHWQYARALAALNARKYKPEIELALQSAIDCETESDLERVMQSRARVLLTALGSDKHRTVQRLAEEML